MPKIGRTWPEELKRPIFLSQLPMPFGLLNRSDPTEYEQTLPQAVGAALHARLQSLAEFLGLPKSPDSEGEWIPANIGRPLGAKGQYSREMLRKVKDLAPTAFQKLCDALDRGGRWGVEFVLNRILPQSRTIELEGTSVDDVKAALQSGDISTAEAKELSVTLEKLNDIGELSDLRARLAKFEKLLLQQA